MHKGINDNNAVNTNCDSKNRQKGPQFVFCQCIFSHKPGFGKQVKKPHATKLRLNPGSYCILGLVTILASDGYYTCFAYKH